MLPTIRRTIGNCTVAAGLLLLALAGRANAEVDNTLGNWFNDPFIQVRQAFPGCPKPLGPLLTRAEMQSQEHSRAERGTRCYLEGKCKRANSYMYDADIAKDLAGRFARSKAFARSSLWITVRRRFVWIEGCVPRKSDAAALESLARGVPDVQVVLVNVTADVGAKVPYEVLKGGH